MYFADGVYGHVPGARARPSGRRASGPESRIRPSTGGAPGLCFPTNDLEDLESLGRPSLQLDLRRFVLHHAAVDVTQLPADRIRQGVNSIDGGRQGVKAFAQRRGVLIFNNIECAR